MQDDNQTTDDNNVILGSETTPESSEDAGQASMTNSEETSTPDVILEGDSSRPIESPIDAIAPLQHDKNDNQEAEADTKETPESEESSEIPEDAPEDAQTLAEPIADDSPARWYVVHTYSGHENRVADTLKQKVESLGLENKILEVLVPTQDKIEIKGGKKETVKEKIFPGYIIVKMILDDDSWLAVRTTQGVTSFVGMGNKPTAIPEHEVRSIVQFMSQGAAPTYKTVYMDGDTVKIVDGPFSEFIGKVDSVDKEKGKVRVLVSIFGRETPVELDFLQVQKL